MWALKSDPGKPKSGDKENEREMNENTECTEQCLACFSLHASHDAKINIQPESLAPEVDGQPAGYEHPSQGPQRQSVGD